jgi:hypothetical protein
MEAFMYSPQISESLIPVLYRIGQIRKVPMTRLVNQLIEKALSLETLPVEIQVMLEGVGKKEQAA